MDSIPELYWEMGGAVETGRIDFSSFASVWHGTVFSVLNSKILRIEDQWAINTECIDSFFHLYFNQLQEGIKISSFFSLKCANYIFMSLTVLRYKT